MAGSFNHSEQNTHHLKSFKVMFHLEKQGINNIINKINKYHTFYPPCVCTETCLEYQRDKICVKSESTAKGRVINSSSLPLPSSHSLLRINLESQTENTDPNKTTFRIYVLNSKPLILSDFQATNTICSLTETSRGSS